ncbi:MAG: hypothetical protein V4605_04975 [Pseudomonadota bacterium]
MNYETDRKAFATMMKVTWQSYGRSNLDADTMRYWFDKLIDQDMPAVERAFDEWLKSQKELPTINEILKLCQHKVTIHSRLPSPLSKQANQEYAKEVLDFVAAQPKAKRDYKGWARKIIANPKDHIDIAVRFAQEALAAKT